RKKLLAKLRILEQLTVERDPDRLIFVWNRLPAAFEVDNRQSPRTQADARLGVELLVIRAAMSDGPGHRQQPILGECPAAGKIQGASNSAHDEIHSDASSPAICQIRQCEPGARLDRSCLERECVETTNGICTIHRTQSRARPRQPQRREGAAYCVKSFS